MDLRLDPGVGTAMQMVTPPLGNRIWLLGIDIWFMNYTVDTPVHGLVVISTGQGAEPTPNEVVYQWESLLPAIGNNGPWFHWFGVRGHRHYSMMKFYEGTARRFAAYMENFEADKQWYAHVSFEISEG